MRAGESGFTLVETLAALSVAALATGGLLLLTGQWFVSWKNAAGRMQATDAAALLLVRMHDDIGAALARADRNGSFAGSAQSLKFLSAGEDGVEEVSWSANAGTVTRAARQSVAAGWREVEAGRVSIIGFEYMTDAGEWRSEWRAATLPRAVRLTLHAGSKDPYVLVAPLRARYPALCARASSASACDAIAAGEPVGLPQPSSPSPVRARGGAP